MDGIRRSGAALAVGLFLVAVCGSASAGIIYVDSRATGANNGASWTDAFGALQDALAEVRQGDEIHVAQGTYKPDQKTAADHRTVARTGDKAAGFRLVSGTRLKGGYAGVGADKPDDRNPQLYQTILSGDLAGNDADNNDIPTLITDATRSDNSVSVVLSQNNTPDTTLDGFVITAGAGSGMTCTDSSPAIVDCVFASNATSFNGGALLQTNKNIPTLTGCTFTANYARQHGGAIYTEGGVSLNDCDFVANQSGMASGAVHNLGGNVTMSGCTFTDNRSVAGGAVEHIGGWLTATDCVFTANSATAGGALTVISGHLSLTDCRFNDNQADATGGAMSSDSLIGQTVRNCLFSSNRAETGGAIFGLGRATVGNCVFENNTAASGGAVCADCYLPEFVNCTFFANRADDGCVVQRACGNRLSSTVVLTSCILWDSGGISVAQPGMAAKVTYSLVQGGHAGAGNIDADPCFAAPGHLGAATGSWMDGDYHLQSQAGRWDPDTQTWVADEGTSLCIDAGDPTSVIGLEPFPNGGTIDMGAYGGTAQASKSYFGIPVCQTIIPGDINGDCRVNMDDLEIMMRHWLEDANSSPGPTKRR